MEEREDAEKEGEEEMYLAWALSWCVTWARLHCAVRLDGTSLRFRALLPAKTLSGTPRTHIPGLAVLGSKLCFFRGAGPCFSGPCRHDICDSHSTSDSSI